MANPEQTETTGAIQVYQGEQIERIGPRAILTPEAIGSGRFFLASDVVVGQYGAIGFVVADNRPESRFVSYTDGEWIGVAHTPGVVRMQYEDPLRQAHFLETEKGFKMIRYFVLHPGLRKFFEGDKFLGDPMIDKMCRDGTLPEDFDEEPANPSYAFWESIDNGQKLVDRVISQLDPKYGKRELGRERDDYRHQAYVSFHPWHLFRGVIEEGESSVVKAIANFDELIGRSVARNTLVRRDLQARAESSEPPLLPPLGNP